MTAPSVNTQTVPRSWYDEEVAKAHTANMRIADIYDALDFAQRGGATVIRIERLRELLGPGRPLR